jgi:hypothetical protein
MIGGLDRAPHSRQSAKLFLQSSAGDCAPLPLVQGGGAHWLAREGVGESQFQRWDIHCNTLMYMYFVMDTVDTVGIAITVRGRACIMAVQPCAECNRAAGQQSW